MTRLALNVLLSCFSVCATHLVPVEPAVAQSDAAPATNPAQAAQAQAAAAKADAAQAGAAVSAAAAGAHASWPPALSLVFNHTAPKYWIVFEADMAASTENPIICDRVSDGENPLAKANCYRWNPLSDYFTTGSLIYVMLLNASSCSAFSIVKDGTQIADDRPLTNGVSNAEGAHEVDCPLHTVVLFLGQFTTNYVGSFSICRSKGKLEAKDDSSAVACTSSSSNNPPNGNNNGNNNAAPSKKTKCPCGNTPPAPGGDKPAAPTGTLVAKSNFEVHKLYRANIVAGFFVSSLVNRQYGITNNGQSTSSANLTYVTVVGPTTRPQYHAFVGVNIYPWRRDVFPGAMSSQGFLGWKKGSPNRLNGYLNPGILVGYGVDSTSNYVVGLNWETSWGINIGSGVHIGQEAYLQPGITPGVTQLPSTATAAPTFNKTSYGWYGSVGFDLNVMKAALSQLFGGGSKVAP